MVGTEERSAREREEAETAPGRGARGAAASDSRLLLPRTTHGGTYQEVLQQSELLHTQRFVPLVLVLSVVVAALLFWMSGHPTAQMIAYGGILAGAFGALALYWLSRDPERYTGGKVTATYLACVVSVFSVVYYWGMFSAATTVVAMGLFFVGVGRSLRLAPERPSAAARLPADADRALAIGMAKRPKDRFATGPELAEAIERALGGSPRRNSERGRTRCWRRRPGASLAEGQVRRRGP